MKKTEELRKAADVLETTIETAINDFIGDNGKCKLNIEIKMDALIRVSNKEQKGECDVKVSLKI